MTDFHPHHIEIDGGTVRAAKLTNDTGSRPDCRHIGDFRFFVDVVEEDGSRLGIWEGANYDDAIREAELARREFGLESAVRDVIVGGAR